MILQGLNFIQALQMVADFIPQVGHDLQWCKELRKKDKHNDIEGVGRMGLHIPDPCMPILKAYHPELFEGEQENTAKEWLKFMKHPDSEPFRVAHNL